tara:strand:- start:339 stop:494 length:156 start_codon:yes stop_codon:yes gene_type:complete
MLTSWGSFCGEQASGNEKSGSEKAAGNFKREVSGSFLFRCHSFTLLAIAAQ